MGTCVIKSTKELLVDRHPWDYLVPALAEIDRLKTEYEAARRMWREAQDRRAELALEGDRQRGEIERLTKAEQRAIDMANALSDQVGFLKVEIERLTAEGFRLKGKINWYENRKEADTRFILAVTAERDQLREALKTMMQAFDPDWPGACQQDCFDTSDGHGYEMQEIAKEKAKAALGEPKGDVCPGVFRCPFTKRNCEECEREDTAPHKASDSGEKPTPPPIRIAKEGEWPPRDSGEKGK